ncbi:hypothetical protein NIES4103_37010 [Nostoc sp. NIES-4103]|nr:hypothetical protein NIES4103_37010 [Nostoc sp. NIES-4103]
MTSNLDTRMQLISNLDINFQLDVDYLNLKEAHALICGLLQPKIPFVVWLLENPNSPLALPGKISLIPHDYIHILLGQSTSPQEEAFVLGFTMGNDLKTNRLHLLIYKFFAKFIYPSGLKFSKLDCLNFDLGFSYGRKMKTKQINEINFELYNGQTIQSIREFLGIDINEIKLIRQSLVG